ncbi:MAG: G5 domain-containing protein, partial [Oscillospiraceae bacterium]|nr:G5 domain-containing protein [Oscillospiraceae bacterium]
MPFKSKKNKMQDNGVKKAGSTLKTIFKRYNPDKVTIDGLKNFFGFVFYKVGYNVEMNFNIIGDRFSKVFDNIFKFISSSFKSLSVFLDKLTDTLLDDLGEPLERISRAITAIGTIIRESKTDKNRSARREMGAYVKEGVAKHRDLAKILYSYLAPVLCCAVFIIVVNYGLGREYAIQVMVGGEEIGTVSNYTVLENANKIIENKLVSTDEQVWKLDSAIKMVPLGKKTTVDERQLANNILATSDEDIVEATGLYVDGEFAGAVQNPEKLNKALEELKEPYENGDENRKVSFVEDVSVLEGIFFTDSVVPDEQLAEMVGSEVSGEKHYMVVSGDSPWTIARKNGITTSTLYALNPDKDFSGLWPGEELVIGASVPFLQVKYVETSTRDVEIAYKTKTEKNNSMNLGTSKTTQKGVKGLNRETVESTYIDGILQNQVVVHTEVIREPVTEIIQQ